jgi:hypothetical protein
MTIEGARVKVAFFLGEACTDVYTAYSQLDKSTVLSELHTALIKSGCYFFGLHPYYSSLYFREDVMTDSEAIELFKVNVKARFG